MKTETGLNPRNFFNDELVDANISSHARLPNRRDQHCHDCEAETEHMKTMVSDGTFTGYFCVHCWEERSQ